ncbi:MAG: YdhR family protein [Rhodospirillales bacterium]|nr:YdhR family protein [Rhodospirillales bacterium]
MSVTAIVRFALPEDKTREAARAAFEASAPLYRSVPGLIRKYYLLSEDGRTGGGVYLFDSREDAERRYDAAWRAGIRERLGAEPSIEYFESPVIVDNEVGAVSSAA